MFPPNSDNLRLQINSSSQHPSAFCPCCSFSQTGIISSHCFLSFFSFPSSPFTYLLSLSLSLWLQVLLNPRMYTHPRQHQKRVSECEMTQRVSLHTSLWIEGGRQIKQEQVDPQATGGCVSMCVRARVCAKTPETSIFLNVHPCCTVSMYVYSLMPEMWRRISVRRRTSHGTSGERQ